MDLHRISNRMNFEQKAPCQSTHIQNHDLFFFAVNKGDILPTKTARVGKTFKLLCLYGLSDCSFGSYWISISCRLLGSVVSRGLSLLLCPVKEFLLWQTFP